MMNISNLILARHSTAFLLHFISYYVMNKKLQVCKQLAFYLLHISSIVLYMFVYKSTQNNYISTTSTAACQATRVGASGRDRSPIVQLTGETQFFFWAT